METDRVISNEDIMDDLGKINLIAFCETSMFFHEIIKFNSVLSNLVRN
jgi:hypothetical protein